MNDIQNREDISVLINSFYLKVMTDPIIGHFFTETNFSLETHIPVMISFWESILFKVPSYSGNPMIKHIALNKIFRMQEQHFATWLVLWESNLHSHFTGPIAQEAIIRARSIAQIMEAKIGLTS